MFIAPKFDSYGNNYPYRGAKSSFYEGGHRVPTIYFSPWLDRRQRGSKQSSLFFIADWLPTFLNIASNGRKKAS